MSVAPHVATVQDHTEFAESRAAERAEHARKCAIAARTVAGHSQNAADCEALLAMLGLDALAGKQVGMPD